MKDGGGPEENEVSGSKEGYQPGLAGTLKERRVIEEKGSDCLEVVGGKKYQAFGQVRQATASCTHVADVQAIHAIDQAPPEARVHVKRLGSGRPPASHHTQFTPAVCSQWAHANRER
jgi:hypothetical protein